MDHLSFIDEFRNKFVGAGAVTADQFNEFLDKTRNQLSGIDVVRDRVVSEDIDYGRPFRIAARLSKHNTSDYKILMHRLSVEDLFCRLQGDPPYTRPTAYAELDMLCNQTDAGTNSRHQELFSSRYWDRPFDGKRFDTWGTDPSMPSLKNNDYDVDSANAFFAIYGVSREEFRQRIRCSLDAAIDKTWTEAIDALCSQRHLFGLPTLRALVTTRGEGSAVTQKDCLFLEQEDELQSLQLAINPSSSEVVQRLATIQALAVQLEGLDNRSSQEMPARIKATTPYRPQQLDQQQRPSPARPGG
jgi:hypothetical protein